MGSITETINNLIIKTSGGILFLWLAVFFYAGKILKWCGKKIAEGANNDLVNKLMPSIAKYVEEKIEDFKKQTIQELKVDLEEVKKALTEYKKEKHNLDGENKTLKEVIKLGDPELINALKYVIENEKK